MQPTSSDRVKNVSTERRRYRADVRRARILEMAAQHFAEHGFGTPTRALAAELGVTQALLYKYFPSKEALIQATLDVALGASADPLEIGEVPAAEALEAFYRRFVARSDETRTRLFVRAGLDGRRWTTRRGDALTRQVFMPAIAMLRRDAGLPSLEALPAMRGERELVMMLHSAMVFFGIRRHVYRMPMPENLDDVITLQVHTFVAGAFPALRALHVEGPESLRVTLLGSGLPAPSATRPGRRRTSNR